MTIDLKHALAGGTSLDWTQRPDPRVLPHLVSTNTVTLTQPEMRGCLFADPRESWEALRLVLLIKGVQEVKLTSMGCVKNITENPDDTVTVEFQ